MLQNDLVLSHSALSSPLCRQLCHQTPQLENQFVVHVLGPSCPPFPLTSRGWCATSTTKASKAPSPPYPPIASSPPPLLQSPIADCRQQARPEFPSNGGGRQYGFPPLNSIIQQGAILYTQETSLPEFRHQKRSACVIILYFIQWNPAITHPLLI